MSTEEKAATQLVGRVDELARIRGLIESVNEAGGALLLRGAVGVGKTSLLEAALALGERLDRRPLVATAAESELEFQFAGLHQVLRPILGEADRLPERQRLALLSAFGLAEETVPDPFLIALASLQLLSSAAEGQPILAAIDDAHWLDDASGRVLGFVARRLETERVVLIASIRDGYESPLLHSELPELSIEDLNEDDAGRLLDATMPSLDPELRRKVLNYAGGNPLALIELPQVLQTHESGAGPWQLIPIPTRLEQAFTDRVRHLPDATQTLLLVAAINDLEDFAESLRAASNLIGNEQSVDVAQPALDAGLISIAASKLTFHHPIVRSAIYQRAPESGRRAAHAALAASIVGQGGRSIWHRARAVVGHDDVLAAEMLGLAATARQRGGIIAAISAQERAAELTSEPDERARRYLAAAEMAFEAGGQPKVESLLSKAEQLDLDRRGRRRATFIHEMFDGGRPGDPGSVLLLVGEANHATLDGDVNLAFEFLLNAALRSWWADPGPEAQQTVVDSSLALKEPADPRHLVVLATMAPREYGALVISNLVEARSLEIEDANALRLLGMAARALGEFELALDFLGSAASLLRYQGRLSLLAQTLNMQAHAAIEAGEFDLVLTSADEARRLATETSQPNWLAGALAALGTVAAVRGDPTTAEEMANEAERILLPRRVSNVLAVVQSLRTMAALSDGRYADALSQIRRVFDPTDVAHHPRELFSAVSLLAESAVLSGRVEEVSGIVEGLASLLQSTPSPQLRLGLAFATALLADDTAAEPLFLEALALHSHRAPFHGARLSLHYGNWLRRQHKPRESRAPLREARDYFEVQGLRPWAEFARRELRASGEASGRNSADPRIRLSPQELQIAQMAADGMTNQEIAERLFLSHRTVGSHLYRIFPKLGVTSRGQIRDALQFERSV